MSDHDLVRELLELAAVEPGGLDRLEAGDAPAAAIVVGHLAGCPDCLEEMARLRRADTLLRPILASQPDPALRDRTLAFVRAVGVARGARPDAVPAPVPGPEHVPAPTLVAAPAAGRRRAVGVPAWIATLAAVLVIGVVGGALLVGSGGRTGDLGTAAAFEAVASETATLLAAGDAHEVVLVDPAGKPAGSLVLSASAGRLLVTATGLGRPAVHAEYRCWVDVSGARTTIGTMHWDGSVAWWAGDVPVPANIPPGVLYGVSLVEVGTSGPGTVVLTGGL